MIPASDLFDQPTITTLLDHDPLVQAYRTFFSLLDWSVVAQWQALQSSRGRPAHPEAAYLKAFLIRLREGILSTSQLRRFLLTHPLLVIDLGFHLIPDPSHLYGFDSEKTLPSDQWLRQKLRSFDPTLLQSLLQATVRDLKEEIPGLGEVVAFDVKHIYAWVKENNWRAYVKERYDKTQIPRGDPDCRLGVKRSTNQEQEDGSIPPWRGLALDESLIMTWQDRKEAREKYSFVAVQEGPGAGIDGLDLSYHIARKLDLGRPGSGFTGRGFQSRANQQAIRQKLSELGKL